MTQVDMPVTGSGGSAGGTWQDVLSENDSWEQLLGRHETWEDILFSRRIQA